MQKINETIAKIKKIDSSLTEKTQKRLDNLTKPRGSLGRLEEIARLIVDITQKENPVFKDKIVFTLAGDHGVTEEGVSPYPREVTAQMVYNFLNGGAGINVLARHVGARVVIADMGVACDLKQNPGLLIKKVNYGTKNIVRGPAMSKEEAILSVENGIALFEEEHLKGVDLAATGEMGIGNTTPSSAIVSVITGRPVEEVTGKGTGLDEEGLNKKIRLIRRALSLNKPNPKDALDVLSKIGGFEIGGLSGVILAAASRRVPVIIDGFISGAAALIAYTLAPNAKDYMIAGHQSVEKGHRAINEYIGLKPLIDLNLRLGEGTGAALSMAIVEAAVKILTQMATFQKASVSQKTEK